MATDLMENMDLDESSGVMLNNMSGGPTIITVIDCPALHVGKVIGPKGSTIREIQFKSGAKVHIDQNFPPNVPRKIHITGTSTSVNTAVQLVHILLSTGSMGGGSAGPGGGGAGGPGSMMSGNNTNNRSFGGQPGGFPSSYSPTPQMSYGGGPMDGMGGGGGGAGEIEHVMEIPKAVVGRIIGKKGETIQLLQRKSGCRMNVDQQVPFGFPCKVRMNGTPQTINIASQLIQEIMISAANQTSNTIPNNTMNTGNYGNPMGGDNANKNPFMPPNGSPQQGMPPGMSMAPSGGMNPSYGVPTFGIRPGPYGAMPMPQQAQFNYGFPPQMASPQPYGMSGPVTATMGGYSPYGQPQQVMQAIPAQFAQMTQLTMDHTKSNPYVTQAAMYSSDQQ